MRACDLGDPISVAQFLFGFPIIGKFSQNRLFSTTRDIQEGSLGHTGGPGNFRRARSNRGAR